MSILSIPHVVECLGPIISKQRFCWSVSPLNNMLKEGVSFAKITVLHVKQYSAVALLSYTIRTHVYSSV